MLEKSGRECCDMTSTSETASNDDSKCDNYLTLSRFLEGLPMHALMFREKSFLQACGIHELQASINR